MNLIDLSHTITNNMPVFPGDEPPSFTQRASFEEDGYTGYRTEMSLHTGTHMDMPLHMVPGGKKGSEMNIERFVGRGVLIDARGKKEISDDLLAGKSIQNGDIILVMTGFSKKFGTKEYYENYPLVTESFADKMVSISVSIVGIDTPSPDKVPYNIHRILLGKEVLLIENLTNLEVLICVGNFEVFAFPPKFDADGSPVRVVARVK